PLAPLREGADVRLRAPHERASPEQMVAGVSGMTGLLPVNGARVDEAVLEAAGPALRIVANFGVGYDNVDAAACKARGVMVTNTPDVLTEATADVAFGLLLAAARRFNEGIIAARTDRWQWAQALLWGHDVAGAPGDPQRGHVPPDEAVRDCRQQRPRRAHRPGGAARSGARRAHRRRRPGRDGSRAARPGRPDSPRSPDRRDPAYRQRQHRCPHRHDPRLCRAPAGRAARRS